MGCAEGQVIALIGTGTMPSDPFAAPRLAIRVGVVYRADEGGYQYSHHPSIVRFGDRFFACWSNGLAGEDSPSQHVRYGTSADGLHWAPSGVLAPDPDGPEGVERYCAAGLWVREGRLIALACRWGRVRYVEGDLPDGVWWENARTEAFVFDGEDWQPQGVVLDNFLPNEAPRLLADGAYLWPGLDRKHNVVFARGGVAGLDAWDTVTLAPAPDGHHMTEPSWYQTDDGAIHCLLRDNSGSGVLYCTESGDGGRSWTDPVPTNFPDATAKFHCLRLSDGRYAVISNPNGRDRLRIPLALSISRDGAAFDSRFILRARPTQPRFTGQYKGPGYQYPNAIEYEGRLYVICSVNKEDVEVTVAEVPQRRP